MPPRDEFPRDPFLLAFGRLVHTCRVFQGLTQKSFGERVGLDQGSVSRLERGMLPGIRLRKVCPVMAEMGLVRRRPPADTPPLATGRA